MQDLAHETLHEFLHLDGKIFQTVKLLIGKPGELTLEYFRGRRARYISPVRLYLTCSLAYFALAALGPAANATFEVNAHDVEPQYRQAVEQVLEVAGERMQEFRRELPHQAPRAMFVLMPTFALMTWAFYRRSQPLYLPHLYYSIHFHAFTFLLLAVQQVLAFAGGAGKTLGGVMALAVIPYHYVALRRVFGGTRVRTAWKGSAILVIYLSIIGLIFVVSMALLMGIPIKRLHLHVS